MDQMQVVCDGFSEQVVHPVYLPFTISQLARHFVTSGCRSRIDDHIAYYVQSSKRFEAFSNAFPTRTGIQLSASKFPCQVEKDERFWAAACWMALYYHQDRNPLARLLSKAFGEHPPVDGLNTWEECLRGDLHLFFEPFLPSPRAYNSWLSKEVGLRHFVPYIIDAAVRPGTNLEGSTHADVLLVNSSNGFSVLTESKVSSDISYEVTFDLLRNQLARSIDVMLEPNVTSPEPLRRRDPHRTVFLLQTPEMFRNNPESRLYGWLMHSYRNRPATLARHLPHRTGVDWHSVAKQLGWITWEDCNAVLPTCCRWLP
jgi:hypothetical protein